MGVITRVVGIGTAGNTGDGGRAIDARPNNPVGLAVTGEGHRGRVVLMFEEGRRDEAGAAAEAGDRHLDEALARGPAARARRRLAKNEVVRPAPWGRGVDGTERRGARVRQHLTQGLYRGVSAEPVTV
jgi:hypothetical protein